MADSIYVERATTFLRQLDGFKQKVSTLQAALKDGVITKSEFKEEVLCQWPFGRNLRKSLKEMFA